MHIQAKADRIATILDECFPLPEVPLRHVNPFTLLVATVLSAQTTDQRVNLVTPALFERAPTPETLAALPEDELRALIRSVGLANTKARNLRALAAQLLRDHGGQVPASFQALEALPGVGHKTASVVMGKAFGVPAFPVDTHIHRLAWRWGLSSGRNVVHTERDLKKRFPPQDWHKRHLQIIYFGRQHCPARGHDAQACPICSWAAPPERLAEEQARQRRSRRG